MTKESSVTLRAAVPGDAEALLAIYRPYVEETSITFEYDVPSAAEFGRRIETTLHTYPYLVAERDGCAVGYAYLSAFHPRAAYAWSAETSIYVARSARGEGIGTLLYRALEDIARRMGLITLDACIAYPNDGSIAFHSALGYATVAHFPRCGWKLGCWWDMVWMEKKIAPQAEPPAPLRSAAEIVLFP